MRRAGAVVALVVAGCVAAPPLPTTDVVAWIPSASDKACAITRVVDGDTLHIDCGDGDVSARLVGFDTPETFQPRCREEAALGKAATRRLEHLLRTASVIAPKMQGTDKYKRALVALTLDGEPLAKLMVKAGLAVPYDGGKRINWCHRL